MLTFLKNFTSDEDGAVTVDWVVLTAAVVGLAAASVNEIRAGNTALSDQTYDYMERQDISGGAKIQDSFGAGSSTENNQAGSS